MCLQGSAHGLAPQNTIFKSPFPVDIQYKTVPTPKAYQAIAAPNSLPATLQTWRVQYKDFSDKDSGLSPGVVSTGKGFADSPDAEVISGGINEKGIDSVAIGRQGPFLFWGFESGPKNMTPSGQSAFLNAIVYISKFDHAPILVRKVAESRDWAIAYANLAQNMKLLYDEEVEGNAAFAKRIADLKEKAKTQKLTADEQSMVGIKLQPLQPYDQFSSTTLKELFPEQVLNACGMTPSAIKAYYEDNYKYLMPKGRAMLVDEDAKALGIGNNDVKLLDKCVELLSNGEDADRAMRLLHRYTNENFATPGEWKAWLDTNRSNLFFSDVGGFKFFSNKPAVKVAVTSEVPTPSMPAVWTAEATPGSQGEIDLTVHVAQLDGWHIYLAAPSDSGLATTKIEAKLPEGASFVGDWDMPPAKPFNTGTMIVEGGGTFTRKFKLPENASGPISIPVTVSWQTCDVERCMPPTSKTIVVTVTPK